jgi:hypothetical protein
VSSPFADEIAYVRNHRYEFLQRKPEFIVALSEGVFSTHHIQQIKSMMDAEQAAIAKAEAEGNIKTRLDPSRLTRAYIRQ